MSKSKLSRIGGWALILSGLRFFLVVMIYAVPDGYTRITAATVLLEFILNGLFI